MDSLSGVTVQVTFSFVFTQSPLPERFLCFKTYLFGVRLSPVLSKIQRLNFSQPINHEPVSCILLRPPFPLEGQPANAVQVLHVAGVRILVDGIPATMPDGQGQATTASLSSAKRIEALRGPLAQLYGNAAGGVLQVFTQDPPITPVKPDYSLSAGAGSDGQRHVAAGIAGGSAGRAARRVAL